MRSMISEWAGYRALVCLADDVITEFFHMVGQLTEDFPRKKGNQGNHSNSNNKGTLDGCKDVVDTV
jgi:hypothetical protein